MNIQKIRIVDKETIVITTTDNKIKWFEKNKLNGPKRTWFDNIIACSQSLIYETPSKYGVFCYYGYL